MPPSSFSSMQIRTASCAAQGCLNSFGDEQLAIDLLADKLLFEALKYSVSSTRSASSIYPSICTCMCS